MLANGTVQPRLTQYLHRDHLGSVDTVTSSNGTVIQRMSFDAWGKRRQPSLVASGSGAGPAWLDLLAPSAIATFDVSATTRGFTGHEMLDPVGLVHMNGRVYDPELGRFLSADPFVQDASNLQSGTATATSSTTR